ncbi:MAG: hypothetical protein JW384_03637 [Nitrosomonadaceae bacterium]|nr:hypothetical protein [Nitrosomonadaceae bacterium]
MRYAAEVSSASVGRLKPLPESTRDYRKKHQADHAGSHYEEVTDVRADHGYRSTFPPPPLVGAMWQPSH